MSEPRSSPIDIPIHPDSRRHSIVSDFLPDSFSFPASFISTSPIIREILNHDIQDCSSDDEVTFEEAQTADADFTSEHEHAADAKLAFHPNGVAYGCGYSAISLQGLDIPVPNPPELNESRHAEIDLLRDNDVLPPVQSRIGWRVAFISGRLCRSLVNTFTRKEKKRMHSGGAHSENTPLLQDIDEEEAENVPPTPPPDEAHELWQGAMNAHRIKTTWQREAKTLLQYSVPLVITFLLHYSVTIGSVLTVGRLGTEELAAVNLATMTASITCYVPVQGLATCLDTLCAQAYGSGHKHLVGLQTQRMTWLLWMLMSPVAVVWWFSEPILTSLIPDKQTANLAALYLRILIVGMPGVAALESGKRFVQSQGLFHATTYTLLIGAPLSFFLNFFFVFKLGWGFAGAAVAMAITQNLLPLLLILYVRRYEGSECWKGFSKKAFRNFGPMMRLALPGMIMIEAQFSVLEILTIAAGQFGTSYLAAQSVLVTVTSTSFNIPFPVAIATSTRVANLIGAQLSDAAKITAKVSIVAACIIGLLNMTALAALHRQLPRVFTEDTEVIEIASKAIYVCALMQVFDSLATVSHGILRGIGRQAIGGYTNLFSYYFVALPVSLSTAFALHWRLSGLWGGLTIGLAVVSGLELLYLYKSDWESAVAQAEARMRQEHAGVESKVVRREF